MFVGLSAFIIGLVEVLRSVGLKIEGVIGHSLGDTLCGYVLGKYGAHHKEYFDDSVFLSN